MPDLGQIKFYRVPELPDDTTDLDKYTGTYAYSRCTIEVSETGRPDELKFDIRWSGSAYDGNKWSMSGIFDPDTFRVTYSNSVKTYYIFDKNEKETTEVRYTDGIGRFQFVDDYLLWQDEQEVKEIEDLGQIKFLRVK